MDNVVVTGMLELHGPTPAIRNARQYRDWLSSVIHESGLEVFWVEIEYDEDCVPRQVL